MCTYTRAYIRTYVHMYVPMHACMYVGVHTCMYLSTYVHMHACTNAHTHMHAFVPKHLYRKFCPSGATFWTADQANIGTSQNRCKHTFLIFTSQILEVTQVSTGKKPKRPDLKFCSSEATFWTLNLANMGRSQIHC